MKRLVLEQLSAGYGEKQVLHQLNLVFHEGEFTALLGLNGSGKTTLLKTICRLLKPTAGKILLNEIDTAPLNRKESATLVSMIPQRHSPQIGVEVLDVILMGANPTLGFFEFPNEAHRESAQNIAQSLGIADKLTENFAFLSEGQKQLVILARTLLQNTPVLLMDEPDSALDFCNKHNMLSHVKSLVVTEKKIGLIATHDPNLAFRYCDRIVLLENGRILGDISLEQRNQQALAQSIQKLYGDVSLLFHEGYFLLLKR